MIALSVIGEIEGCGGADCIIPAAVRSIKADVQTARQRELTPTLTA